MFLKKCLCNLTEWIEPFLRVLQIASTLGVRFKAKLPRKKRQNVRRAKYGGTSAHALVPNPGKYRLTERN